MFNTKSVVMIMAIFIISGFVAMLLFVFYNMVWRNRITSEGLFIGVCINKYISKAGNNTSNRNVKTNYYVCFITNSGKQKVLECNNLIYDKITIGDKLRINYKIINNKRAVIDRYVFLRKGRTDN